MKYLQILLVIFSYNSVFSQNESEHLSFINWCREIELSQTNDKCGEWGGNTELIRVYQKDCKGELYIDYQKTIMDCDDPIAHYTREDTNEIKTILINSEEKKLIEKCITELLERKLSNSEHFTHSGIINRVVYSDSTLVIKDYPSTEWKSFNELTQRLGDK